MISALSSKKTVSNVLTARLDNHCSMYHFFYYPSSPTPIIKWEKLGHKLPDKARVEHHGKLLVVPSVDEGDNGKYMCKASNSHGVAQHFFTVTVEGKRALWTVA